MTASTALRPMRLRLGKTHLRTLCAGGRVQVHPRHHMLLDETGGAVCHVLPETYTRAAKCLRADRPWHLRMCTPEIAASIVAAGEHGGGWGDFTDWLAKAGKAVVSGVAKYALPLASAILDVLPSSDPRLVALKTAIKVVGQLATQLDKAVNSADYAEEKSAEAHLDVATAEEESADAAAAAAEAKRSKDISAEKRATLLKLAAEAKKRVAAKKKAAKEAEAKAKAEHAKVAKIEAEKKAALAKHAAAEKKAAAAAAALAKKK